MNDALRLVRAGIRATARRVLPKQYLRYRLRKLGRSFPEVELRLLPCLCERQKLALDIGASVGFYTAHLLRMARRCIAFEPRPAEARALASMLSSVGAPASVEAVALSDRAGCSVLRILLADPGRSTVEASNLLEDEGDSDVMEISVPLRKLDDYRLNDVGFIKIDVEGHELKVLSGGRETIVQSRPTLLIEIEERHRHNALRDVTDFFTPLKYSVFFLHGGRLHPSFEFRRALHQDSRNAPGWRSGWESRGVYINNFVFVPSERSQKLLRDVAALIL
jgi:FkbM family methyltransferase